MHKIFTVGPDHLLPSITPSTRSAPPASAGRAREPHHVIRSYLLVAGTGPVSCGRRRPATLRAGASGVGGGGGVGGILTIFVVLAVWGPAGGLYLAVGAGP